MNAIKELRKEKGLSQSELADLIGVSDVSINKYEKGLMKPKIDKLAKMSEVFGVPIEYITDEYKNHIERIIRPACISQAEYERLKEIEEKYNAFKNSGESADIYKYNLMKLDNGLWINGTRVNHLIDCKIDSSVDDPTEVTLKFVAKVDGLDNIDIDRYSFDDKE